MYLVKVKWKGSCPNHPRFNPEKGEGAVKGNCSPCLRLVTIHERVQDATHNMRVFDELKKAVAGRSLGSK